MLYAMRQALREPLAELRTARRRQEDLLRDISTSATYLADVADVWAESEAERNAGREADCGSRRPMRGRAAFGPGAESHRAASESPAPSTAS